MIKQLKLFKLFLDEHFWFLDNSQDGFEFYQYVFWILWASDALNWINPWSGSTDQSFRSTVTKKLTFTTSEKYVDDFVNNLELSKEIKKVAANIVQSAWYLHKSKSKPTFKFDLKFMSMNAIKQNRSLLGNIQKIRELRLRQRDLNSSSINTLEIYRQCKQSDLEIHKLRKKTLNLEIQSDKIQTKIELIESKLDKITSLLTEITLKK